MPKNGWAKSYRLHDAVSVIDGVGKNREAALGDLGIHTVFDLITYYPRDYEDRSVIIPLSDVITDRVNTVKGYVGSKPRLTQAGGFKIVKAIISGDGSEIEAVWFNQPYLVSYFKPGTEYAFTGKVTERFGKLQLESPEYERWTGETVNHGRIIPIYRLTSGITQKLIRKLVGAALDALPQIGEYLPENVISANKLLDRVSAIRNIHFPSDSSVFYSARKRLVFDELLIMQLALFKLKASIKTKNAITIRNFDYSFITKKLPYVLTNAQSRVVDEMLADFSSGFAMSRLVQGDVGSGKTAVAMIAAYLMISCGYQAALMAPTETLAKQHYDTFRKIFGDEIKTVFLSGSVTKKEKALIYEEISSGAASMIIGTHALIEEVVVFKNLGLVVTDEQHRFGTLQRLRLSDKGACPHTLIMSATPIPRTLALMLYGDLDISVIDELPPGRLKVDTYVIDAPKRDRAYGFIGKEIEKGRQAYIICPAIEESEALEMKAALTHVESVRRRFPDRRVAALHGRMKNSEKNEVMERFSQGEFDILVSTTVIEVGINVPNSTVMLIENAERFGLSQLHQLRGRVGRGAEKSYCVLLSDSKASRTLERLRVMSQTNDGFLISELDLKFRGHGDLFGTRQAGLPEFKIANLHEDMPILAIAQAEAKKLTSSAEYITTGAFPSGIEAEVNYYLKHKTKISI